MTQQPCYRGLSKHHGPAPVKILYHSVRLVTPDAVAFFAKFYSYGTKRTNPFHLGSIYVGRMYVENNYV